MLNTTEIANNLKEALRTNNLQAFHEIETKLSWDERKVNSPVREDGTYRFIPFNPNELDYDLVRGKSLVKSPKFVDVGCGLGTKVILAHNRGYEAWGIEIDPDYVKNARAILKAYGLPEERIIQHDAVMFRDYAQFGMIYFYCPIYNRKDMQVLEETIWQQISNEVVVCAKGWENRDIWRPIVNKDRNSYFYSHLSRKKLSGK